MYIHTVVACTDNCARCVDGSDNMCTECNPGYWRTGSPGTCSGKNNYMTSPKKQQLTTTQQCHNNSTTALMRSLI